MRIDGNEIELGGFPAVETILSALLATWPEHHKFTWRSFRDRAPALMESTDRTCRMILALEADDIAGLCADYRWTCEQLQIEEIHFRRTGGYRHTRFAEAEREVYSNAAFMQRYVRGLLLSHVMWSNHAAVIEFYVRHFLPALPAGERLLEVGPGHGLLLCLAAADGRELSLSGWDVSQASVDATAAALEAMGVTRPVGLLATDILSPELPNERFGAILLCEILEHLEEPDRALANIRRLVAPGGRIFVNVPLNSPAPDHIHLLRSPKDAVALIERNGFRVVDAQHFPMGGNTLERSERFALTISSALIAEPA